MCFPPPQICFELQLGQNKAATRYSKWQVPHRVKGLLKEAWTWDRSALASLTDYQQTSTCLVKFRVFSFDEAPLSASLVCITSADTLPPLTLTSCEISSSLFIILAESFLGHHINTIESVQDSKKLILSHPNYGLLQHLPQGGA